MSVARVVQVGERNGKIVKIIIITPDKNIFFFVPGNSNHISNQAQAQAHGQIGVKTYKIGSWGLLTMRSITRTSVSRDSGHNLTIEPPGISPRPLGYSSLRGCCRLSSTTLPTAAAYKTLNTKSNIVEGIN
jgi:hypothetical protein